MSGIDQFLAQHYGTLETGPTAEDIEKVAQAEMFLKLAAQNNVDVNQLSNAQIDELWGQVWSEKTASDAQTQQAQLVAAAQAEHEQAKTAAAEGQEKFAEADYMGRIMAHSYVNQLRGIAEQGGLDFMKEAADEAGRVRKVVDAAKKHGGDAAEAVGRHLGNVGERISRVGLTGIKRGPHEAKGVRSFISRHGKAVGGAAYGTGAVAAGGAAAGAHHALKKKDEEKTSSALDEFAANAAVEKAAAAGFDADEAVQRINAVFILGPGESDKVAYVEGLENAVDVRSSELLELAGYPVDWSNTPFAKTAMKPEEWGTGMDQKLVHRALAGAEHTAKEPTKLQNLTARAGYKGRQAAEWVGKHKAFSGGIGAGVAAVGGGAAYLKHRSNKKKEEGASKESSVNFDIAAAEMAVAKTAEAGWDPQEATDRINSLFNLGYEGDPEASEKVAAATDGEQALAYRACELLELAGYTINW